jgi:RHS repeat-associated protein
MANAAVGAGTYAYGYDGDGKRLTTATTNTSGTIETSAEWDITQPVPEITAERDETGAVTRRYSYGLDRIATTTDGVTSLYLADAMGSVTNLTSTTGAKQWTHDYEPYGAARSSVHDDPTAPGQPIGFTGEHLDATGLYHLRARQYDTTTGRLTTTDPLAPSIDDPYVSSYIYVNQRPTVLVDPTGEKGRSVGAAAKPAASPTKCAKDRSTALDHDWTIPNGYCGWSQKKKDQWVSDQFHADVAEVALNCPALCQFGILVATFYEGPSRTSTASSAEPSASRFSADRHGRLTNGSYTIDKTGMAPHKTGSLRTGKSQWFSRVDAEGATLDAAKYADEHGLWRSNKAKVPVVNGNVGALGTTGEPTSWINVYRTDKGFVHGSPGSAP